jgi:hypothetical protein
VAICRKFRQTDIPLFLECTAGSFRWACRNTVYPPFPSQVSSIHGADFNYSQVVYVLTPEKVYERKHTLNSENRAKNCPAFIQYGLSSGRNVQSAPSAFVSGDWDTKGCERLRSMTIAPASYSRKLARRPVLITFARRISI